jgi:hypothetical protein
MTNVSVKVFSKTGQLVGPLDLPRVEERRRVEGAADAGQCDRAAHGASGRSAARCWTTSNPASIRASAAGCRCLRPTKFESGTGWPSFFQPIADENVATKPDRSYGVLRVRSSARGAAAASVTSSWTDRCRRGSVCVNSESLAFTHVDELSSLADPSAD